jgi:ferredoxin-NADP reductase
MAILKLRLTGRKEIARDTFAFYFQKPPSFNFRAGQFVHLSLIRPPKRDTEGETRAFSIASAPHEDELMFATRARDTAFKQIFTSMPIGTRVRIIGPLGSLTLQSNQSRPVVLIAGGIGITPFRSIIVDASQKSLPSRIILFYSNRRPEDAAFLEELRELEHQYPKFTLISTMTQTEKAAQHWQGKTGYFTTEFLAESIGNVTRPIHYVAGPPGMVRATRRLLDGAGVKHGDIRTEEFDGYANGR